jgi:hypothetical protein
MKRYHLVPSRKSSNTLESLGVLYKVPTWVGAVLPKQAARKFKFPASDEFEHESNGTGRLESYIHYRKSMNIIG